ncbi:MULTISPECIES: hypothetical protein [Mesoplasma]|uniref:Phosphatidic acid phosphatase type 2/haloperoxidase domain-containing protein n=1 Tax=Mesoplasma florum TaxID=2151 RepID=A0A2R3P6L1_MESFO|nr:MULTISPECIES: hypothetical protein [Mesoplasma]AVN64136.1 hypothetical protein CG003_00375 [Mesoplasma florum]
MKKHFEIKENKHWIKLYWIVLVMLFTSLMATTFFDYQITSFFAKGMNNYFLRQIVNFVSSGGNFIITIPIGIISATILETLYLKYKIKNNFIKFTPYILLIIGMIFFGSLYCIQKSLYTFADDIKNNTLNSIWIKALTTWKEPIIICSVWIIIMTLILSYGAFFFRVKFASRKDILQNKYWIGALEMLTVFLISYFSVLVLKIFFARPFYFSVEYRNLFGMSDSNEIDHLFDGLTIENYVNHPGAKLLIDLYLKTEGLDLNDNNFKLATNWMAETLWQIPYGPAPEPVWKWTYWFIPNIFSRVDSHTINDGIIYWSSQAFNGDFPSGHIEVPLSIFGTFFIIKRSGKVDFKNKKILLFTILTSIMFILTFFFMIVYRFHWITDMIFTPILYLAFLPIAYFKTEKWINMIFFKFSKNKKILIISKSNKIEFKMVINEEIVLFKTKNKGKKAFKYEYKIRTKYSNLIIEKH